MHSTNDIATTGFACAIVFAVILIGVHWDRRELDPRAASLSTYFAGSTRMAMFMAYFLLAVSLACVAVVLATDNVTYRLVSAGFCGLAAVALIPIGLTARRLVGDPDVRSPLTIALHRYFALAAFFLVVASMLAYSVGLFVQGPSSSIAWIAGGVALAGLVNLLVVFWSRPGPDYGLKQKMLVLLVVVWIGLVSTQLTLWPTAH